MPTVVDRIDVEIEFSVYCGICGSGVCGDTTVDNRRNDITVTCSTCQNKIAELEAEIEILNDQIGELEDQLNEKE